MQKYSLVLDYIYMTKNDNMIFIRNWYTAKSAAHITGLSLAMVNYLCREELVVPAAGSKRGKGNARQYSFTDLLMLRMIKRLLANDISVLNLKKSFKAMRGRGMNCRDLLSQKYVVTDGKSIYFKNDGVIELIESGQLAFAFVLELGAIREEVTANIQKQAA